MPRQTEPSANNALGGLLQVMMPKSQVRSENTRAIAGHPGLRPDILITASDRAPVVVEAEYMPAATVEAEARERADRAQGLHRDLRQGDRRDARRRPAALHHPHFSIDTKN